MHTQFSHRKIISTFTVFILLLTTSFGTIKLFAQQTPWIVPKTAEAVKNPAVSSAPLLADAKVIYTTNCSPCHGDKGHGNGPAAAGLNIKPADHTSTIVQNESDGALFWKLSEGRNPMPGYKKILSEQQRWELILYIRSLAKNKK